MVRGSPAQGGTVRTAGRRRAAIVLAVLLVATLSSIPVRAQSDPDDIDALREQKFQIDAERLAKAREIDAANAEIEELIDALAVLQAWVNSQSVRVAATEQLLSAAEDRASAADDRVNASRAEIEVLRNRLRIRAIESFIGEGDRTDVWSTGDPHVSVRQKALAGHVLGSEIDIENALNSTQQDLERDQAEADAALAEVAALDRQVQAELAELESDQADHLKLLTDAEDRLDHLLSERAALQAVGERVAKELRVAELALAEQLAAAPGPIGGPVTRTSALPLATPDEIAHAGNGILVHVSIVDDVRRLLADAAAAGIELGGGGYRDSSAQIRLRRRNCGTSDFAIFEMRASQCRPPTAKPGASMHERGLAIDFTHQGRLIRSRRGPAWEWLRDNAANYGFFNLPSEPWHFSVNGR